MYRRCEIVNAGANDDQRPYEHKAQNFVEEVGEESLARQLNEKKNLPNSRKNPYVKIKRWLYAKPEDSKHKGQKTHYKVYQYVKAVFSETNVLIPSKTKVIIKMSLPTDVAKLQSFPGMSNYLEKFIQFSAPTAAHTQTHRTYLMH